MFEAFPAVVKAELARLGKSQQWLAETIDVSHVSVSNWLGSRRRPSAENVVSVARALGRSASWLFAQMERAEATTDASAADVARSTWDAAWDAASERPSASSTKAAAHPGTGDVTLEMTAEEITKARGE